MNQAGPTSPAQQRGTLLGQNPIFGVALQCAGGFAAATSFIPFRGIKRWSWEVYWVVQALVGWLLAPWIAAAILVPHLGSILDHAWQSDPASVYGAVFWGILAGVGGISFGLAVRYLGIALGYAISLAAYIFFAGIFSAISSGDFGSMLHSPSGHSLIIAVLISLVALVLTGAAARSKDHEITVEEKLEAGERDYASGKGVAIALLAGLMSVFFVFGLATGNSVTALTAAESAGPTRSLAASNLPVLALVLTGGFLTNLVWSVILLFRNRSTRQFSGEPGMNPMRATAAAGTTLVDFDPLDPSTYDRVAPRTLAANYTFAAVAGLIWFVQFFLYGLGHPQAGAYGFSSEKPAIVSIVLFAMLWGVALHEWKETSARTRLLVTAGVALLIAAIALIG